MLSLRGYAKCSPVQTGPNKFGSFWLIYLCSVRKTLKGGRGFGVLHLNLEIFWLWHCNLLPVDRNQVEYGSRFLNSIVTSEPWLATVDDNQEEKVL